MRALRLRSKPHPASELADPLIKPVGVRCPDGDAKEVFASDEPELARIPEYGFPARKPEGRSAIFEGEFDEVLYNGQGECLPDPFRAEPGRLLP